MDEQIQPEQNQTERELTKKERRHLRREEKRMQAERAKKTKGVKNLFVWAVVLVLVAAAGFGIYKYLFSGAEGDSVVYDPTKSCIDHRGAGMHIHPNLRTHVMLMTVNGEESAEFENLIFKDADRIEIKYEVISE